MSLRGCLGSCWARSSAAGLGDSSPKVLGALSLLWCLLLSEESLSDTARMGRMCRVPSSPHHSPVLQSPDLRQCLKTPIPDLVLLSGWVSLCCPLCLQPSSLPLTPAPPSPQPPDPQHPFAAGSCAPLRRERLPLAVPVLCLNLYGKATLAIIFHL